MHSPATTVASSRASGSRSAAPSPRVTHVEARPGPVGASSTALVLHGRALRAGSHGWHGGHGSPCQTAMPAGRRGRRATRHSARHTPWHPLRRAKPANHQVPQVRRHVAVRAVERHATSNDAQNVQLPKAACNLAEVWDHFKAELCNPPVQDNSAPPGPVECLLRTLHSCQVWSLHCADSTSVQESQEGMRALLGGTGSNPSFSFLFALRRRLRCPCCSRCLACRCCDC